MNDLVLDTRRASLSRAAAGAHFSVAKRAFDLVVATLLLLPLTVLFGFVLLAWNAAFDRGPLFFVQKRMGHGCRPIRVWKFRSMTHGGRIRRRADDPLEVARITAMGRFIRRTRIDELPQVVNVLRGEMSVIGPRPDYFPHALQYLRTIPGYRQRHAIRPGITGLAQVSVGYAEGTDATRGKVAADLAYVSGLGYALDMRIVLRTLGVILSCRGV